MGGRQRDSETTRALPEIVCIVRDNNFHATNEMKRVVGRGEENREGLQTALITCNGADDNYNNESREEQQKSEAEKESRQGQQRNRAADCISSGISAFSSVRTAARTE